MRIYGKDISMIRGDTESLRVSVKKQYGSRVPLTEGDLVYFTVKESARDEEKLLQIIVSEFDDGDAIIKIESEDTKALMFKTYYYDIQLVRTNGDVKTIVPPSKFIIGSEITYE